MERYLAEPEPQPEPTPEPTIEDEAEAGDQVAGLEPEAAATPTVLAGASYTCSNPFFIRAATKLDNVAVKRQRLRPPSPLRQASPPRAKPPSPEPPAFPSPPPPAFSNSVAAAEIAAACSDDAALADMPMPMPATSSFYLADDDLADDVLASMPLP